MRLSGIEVGLVPRNRSSLCSLSANSLRDGRRLLFEDVRYSCKVRGGADTRLSLAMAMSMDESGSGERSQRAGKELIAC
jgi:hypothetical protein